MDISVIIPAHKEGRLAHHTMNSVFRAAEYASESGIRTEIVVVLDRPDKKTQEYFGCYKDSEVKLYTSDFGDAGLARNHGVESATGKYAAFSDADDLFGKNWLKTAFHEAERRGEYSVYYPEYVICFEGENLLVRCKDSDDEALSVGNMIEYNCWNSVHFLASRTLLLENPFVPTPLESGFGYEDWHWYCEIIAKRIRIRIVPDSCVFYRKKLQGSRLFEHNHSQTVIPKSKLFEPAIFSSLMNKEKA